MLGLSSMTSRETPPSSVSFKKQQDGLRPGLRRRGTGPPSKEEREAAGEGAEEWELSTLREKAEDAVAKLAKALAGSGHEDDPELRKQLSQLNIPVSSSRSAPTLSPLSTNGVALPSQGAVNTSTNTPSKPKSNLYSPNPPNMPLALLKLMEAYVIGLADVPVVHGGWSEAKRERALAVIKALAADLGHAERLSSSTSCLRCCGEVS